MAKIQIISEIGLETSIQIDTMKIKLLLFCLLALLGSGMNSIAQTGDMQTIIDQEKAAWLRRELLERTGDNAAVNRSDLKYSRFHWQVDPAVYYIKGEVMTVFEPVENLGSLDFDFSAALTMDSIVYHGQSIPFTQGTGDILTVHFPDELPAFIPDSLTFFYQGVPTSTGFGSFATHKHGPDSIPVLWTLSEPYGAREWYPCKISLDDKLDSIDIFVTAPSQYRTASNGLLMSENTQNGFTTAHWKHRYPITTYLIGIAVTNYVEFENLVPAGDDTIRVLNYVYPEQQAAAVNGTQFIVSQMQLFNELFGVYPFKDEKYGHAQFEWGGGIEHQTMSFMYNFGYELMAHELAHQWFGDKVTCASWEDIWLNEGFATYMSGLCYEFLAPQYWQNFKQQRITNITNQPGGSLRVSDTTSVARIFDGRLTYAKGAMVLNTLRWICGDSAFFAASRNYLNAPGIAFGYAHTEDLQHFMEEASGKDLDGFFADWYIGEGYPSYQLSWSQDDFNHLVVNLGQQPSHPSVSFFELPVPVRFSNGQQDTILVFQHEFSGQSFAFDLDFAVSEVTIDPDLWLISKTDTIQRVSNTKEAELPGLRFRVLPNPAHGHFDVSLQLDRPQQMRMFLVDMSGKVLEEKNVGLGSGKHNVPFELKNYPAGTYTFMLKTDSGQVSRAIVVF